MSILDDALNKLKEDIVKIKGKPMKLDTRGLDNLTDSEQNFVNPALLPSGIEKPKDTVSPEESNYPEKVMQAVWNIADTVKLDVVTIGKLLINSEELTNNFAYLDSSWIPHVIDSKTHQTAVALLAF